MTLTIGSLFSGYGGLDLAIGEVLGAETVWVSDVEEGPNKVLGERFPDSENIGDITKVDWPSVTPVDIISGGSPCQDVSAAGRRAGMTEGTRSNLWVQMREAIRTLRPAMVVWENVRGAHSAIASSSMELDAGRVGEGGAALRATGRVLGDLAALGYDAEWATIPATLAGAPHRRERVFVLGWDASLADPRSGRGRGGHDSPREGSAGEADAETEFADRPPLPPRRSRGRLVLPTPRASSGPGASAREIAAGNPKFRLETEVALLPTLSVADVQGGRKHRSGKRSDELLLNGIAHYERFGEYAPAIRRWEAVIGRAAPEPTVPSPRTGKPQLSAPFVEWMMGLPDRWVTDEALALTRRQQLKLLGNGVVPQQAVVALSSLLERMEEEIT